MLDITNVGYEFYYNGCDHPVYGYSLAFNKHTGSHYAHVLLDLYFFVTVNGVYLVNDDRIMVQT
jgi:hypothetical protein